MTATFKPPDKFNQYQFILQLPAHTRQDFMAVNHLLDDSEYATTPYVKKIIHHILKSGGKRLRTLLTLLCARAIGYQGKKHITLAVAIELIHNASLLHDDVIDHASTRRYQPTVNHKWDNSSAVLVGDFLYSRAMYLLATLNDASIVKAVAKTSNRISEGEIMQLLAVGDVALNQKQYLKIIESKTAILFGTAMHASTLLLAKKNQPPPLELLKTMEQTGIALGIAFQMCDDVKDYYVQGKSKDYGKDLIEGKITLPMMIALAKANATQKQQLKSAMQNHTADALPQVMEIFQQHQVYTHCFTMINQYKQQALAGINTLTPSLYQQSLIRLIDYITRDFVNNDYDSSARRRIIN